MLYANELNAMAQYAYKFKWTIRAMIDCGDCVVVMGQNWTADANRAPHSYFTALWNGSYLTQSRKDLTRLEALSSLSAREMEHTAHIDNPEDEAA